MLSNYIRVNKKYIITLLLILVLITADQVTKIKISIDMMNSNYETVKVTPFLNIVYVRNTGISFGFLNEGGIIQRWVLTVFAAFVGVFLTISSMFSNKILFKLALVFISAGAIGNAIDRLYFGGVIDFIDFFIYNIHWPAFNLADTFIFTGVVFLIIDSLYSNKVK